MTNDIIQQTELLYFEMQLMQARIKLESMIVANKEREIAGDSFLAYNEKAFIDLIEECQIHHMRSHFRGDRFLPKV